MSMSGRISCPRCGANNFDTVTVCWKCGAPLGPNAPVDARGGLPPVAPQAGAQPAFAHVRNAAASALANRSAVALGLMFPYFGLPIALAFMMCDDPRRQEVGRICLIWSVVSSVGHVLLALSGILSVSALMGAMLGSGHAGGGGLRLPGGMPGGLPGTE